MKKQKLGGSHT